MTISNNKKKANYLNFRVGGAPKKIMIAAGKSVNIAEITSLSQIINMGDFNRGFFSVIEEAVKEVVNVDKKNEISSSYNVFIQQKTKINQEIAQIKKQIKLYEQDKCPTCETPFSEARFELIKEQLNADIL